MHVYSSSAFHALCGTDNGGADRSSLMAIVRLEQQCVQLPHSGKFSYGANFRIFRMKPRDTKIKTAKILTVKILTSNFERVIGSGEQAVVFYNGISSLRMAFQTPVDPSTPVSLLR